MEDNEKQSNIHFYLNIITKFDYIQEKFKI